MKIKSDFITNSSSTAFVVAIPEDFNPSDEELITAIKNQPDYDYFAGEEEFDLNKSIEGIKDSICELKQGDEVWQGDIDEDRYVYFHAIIELCEKYDYIIKSFEYHSDGCNQIHGVSQEDIETWLASTRLKSLERIGQTNE